MSVVDLLNQTVSVYGKSSYDSFGREVVGSATTVMARFQPKSKTKFLANGAILSIDAIVYVKSDANVNIDDRVDYLGIKYKVVGKYPVPDGQGNTNHIQLELIKWQET